MLEIPDGVAYSRELRGQHDTNLVRLRNARKRRVGKPGCAVNDDEIVELSKKSKCVLHGGRWRRVGAKESLRRVDQIKPGVMLQKKPLQEFLIKTIGITGQLVKAILVSTRPQIERRITLGRMLVDQDASFFAAVRQMKRQMKSDGSNSGAALGADKSNDLSAAYFVTTTFPLLRFDVCQPVNNAF